MIWNTWRFPERAAPSRPNIVGDNTRTRVEGELRSYPRAKNITYTRDFRVAGWSTQQRPTGQQRAAQRALLSFSHSLFFLVSSSSRLIPRCQRRRWRRLRTMAQSRCLLLLNWNTLPSGARARALKVHARGETRERRSLPTALKRLHGSLAPSSRTLARND